MKTKGTNYICSVKTSDLINNASSNVFHLQELPNGGEENGVLLAYDTTNKLFYIVGKDEKVSSNGTGIIDGYQTSDGITLTHFQYDTNIPAELPDPE